MNDQRCIVVRRRVVNDVTTVDYYRGDGLWTRQRPSARILNADTASIICENLTNRYGWDVTFQGATD